MVDFYVMFMFMLEHSIFKKIYIFSEYLNDSYNSSDEMTKTHRKLYLE